MFRFLVLFLLMATPASATGLETWLVTTLVAAGIGETTAAAIALAVSRFAVSTALGIASSLLGAKKASGADAARELGRDSNRPAYRFAYGHTRVPGSYAPALVKGNILYACLILNSRASEGNFTIYLDKREVEVTGDLYDFTLLGGAAATNDPFTGYLKAWIGKGDQTTPPVQITDEAPELFQTTDGWQGRTVLWLRLDVGPSGSRNERWPRARPEVEVEGDWSLVYDPREVSHDLNDPTTWAYSASQGPCLMDALTQNPIEQYRPENLMVETFAWCGDVADEDVVLKNGGTEKRYPVGGVIVFNGSEIEDQVGPLVSAGASELVRVAGRLGVSPGTYQAPVYTLTDALDDGFEFEVYKRGGDLPTQLRVTYVSPDRNFEEAELQPWDIPGALVADGGIAKVRDLSLPMVTSPTQAMRIRQIIGRTARMQKGLKCIAPPDAFELVGGSRLTVGFGAGFERLNGEYRALGVHPAFDPLGVNGDEGVALRCPIDTVETSATIYAWDELTDEEDVLVEAFDADRSGIEMPGAITASTGSIVDEDRGSYVTHRILFAFPPSTSVSVTGYEWEYRKDDDLWQSGGWVDREALNSDAPAKNFGYLSGISPTSFYDVRVRAVSPAGKSDWQVINNVSVDFALTGVSAAAIAGGAQFLGNAPDVISFAGLRVYRSDVAAAFGTALAVSGLIPASANGAFDVSAGDPAAVNIVTNSDFADGSDWSGTNWTIASGKATHAPVAANSLRQTNAMDDGADYRITFTVLDRTADVVRLSIFGDTTVTGANRTANATFQEILTAPINTTQIGVTAFPSFDGSVDDFWTVKDTPECLAQGQGDFWIVPVTQTGAEGAPIGPFTLTIP